MADASSFNVHDINVSEQAFFGLGGSVSKRTRVTFWVGTHGPFVRDYEPGQATTDKIQSDINSQVQQLRIIGGLEGTGA
jgi:hypothetical protein